MSVPFRAARGELLAGAFGGDPEAPVGGGKAQEQVPGSEKRVLFLSFPE